MLFRSVGRSTDDVCDATAPPLPRRFVAIAPSFITVPTAVVLVLGLLSLQQIVVSAVGLESEPLVSNFPMYSWTWPSREAFAAHLREKYRAYEMETPGLESTTMAERLNSVGLDDGLRRRVFDAVAAGRDLDDDERRSVAAAAAAYEARFGAAIPSIRVVRYEGAFDWARGVIDHRDLVGFDSQVDLAALPASGGEH